MDPLVSPGEAARRAQALGLPPETVGRAAAAAVASPTPVEWRRLLALVSGALGAGLFASGVITFIAFNWAGLGPVARLALVEVPLALTVGIAASSLPRLAGGLAASVGAILVGGLLAVFGQTYQTGADPFELFVMWAALIVPFTLAARFEPLYLLETVVLGTGIVLAWVQLGEGDRTELLYPALSTWALAVLAIATLPGRWLHRVWAVGAGLSLAGAAFYAFIARDGRPLVLAAVAVSFALVVWRYHLRTRDLFMQTVLCGVLMAVVTTALGRVLVSGSGDPFGPLVLLGLAVTAQAAAAVAWLRRQREH